MVRTKVFVGNLAFSTKEPELAAAFGAAGKVIGANIITRGPRSLGYGFVEMDSEEDAKKAVELMNKKEVNGRQINVEIAKPQDETKANAQQGENGSSEEKKRRPRRRTPGRRQGAAPESASEEGGQAQGGEGEGAKKKRPKRHRGPRGGPKKDSEEGAAANREESKTTLFVANLPFGLDDEGFAKVVSELGIKAKTAHVVKKRNGRSKGYGFVEFDNEADQRKALDGLNKKSVDGRELSVKIALTERPGQEGEASPSEKKTQKPASPAEKKAAPAEKKATPVEKKTSSPAEKKAAPAEKKAAPAEKKTPTSEKKSTPPVEKKTEKDTPAAKETKATDKK